jgi:hypothetical protein
MTDTPASYTERAAAALASTVWDVLGDDACRLALGRALAALYATPPDADSTWPISALQRELHAQPRRSGAIEPETAEKVTDR